MNTPNIRFKGFAEDWEQRKLGDMVTFSKGTGYSKSDLQGEGTPIILYGRLYTKYETVISDVDTFAEEKPNSMLSKGREVIVPASGETAEDISVASVVEKEGVLLGGDLNIITPPENLDSAFLALSISNGKPHNDMAKMAQGKSVVHLHNSDLAKIDLPYPSYDEQYKISSSFIALDNLITLHQRKCDSLKQVKKYMLQKMFPKQGEKVPEIRFAGFTGDWEQRKLGDIADVTKLAGFEFTEHVVYSDEGQIIALRGLNIKNGQLILDDVKYIDGSNFSKLTRSKLFIDDIMFTYVGTVGEVALIRENDRFYLAPNVSRIRVESDDSPKFISHYMRMGSFYKNVIVPLIATSSQAVLSMENIRKFELYLPKDKTEQVRIADYLEKMDNLITFHQRKSDSLKQVKKYMLQNMFPQ